MRPLFHGRSAESIFESLQSKIPRNWRSHKRSHREESTSVRNDAGEDHSSLNRLTKPDYGMSVGTHIESIGMNHLDSTSPVGLEGIAVHRELSTHSESL